MRGFKDAVKIAKKAGRFDHPGFDEISLASENRQSRGCKYHPPSEVIRRVCAELKYLDEEARVKGFLHLL